MNKNMKMAFVSPMVNSYLSHTGESKVLCGVKYCKLKNMLIFQMLEKNYYLHETSIVIIMLQSSITNLLFL